ALAAAGSPGASHQTPAPQLAYQGDGRRVWLLAVQLYGVRSSTNWGHGDFGDLLRLVDIAADVGAAGIGLNPLHALFYDRAGSGSPYSPSSRLFLNPLYIDVAAIAEFRSSDANQASEIQRLREAELVDYAAVTRLKLGALRRAYRRFQSGGT